MPTVMCPSCSKLIPSDAVVCPYCARDMKDVRQVAPLGALGTHVSFRKARGRLTFVGYLGIIIGLAMLIIPLPTAMAGQGNPGDAGKIVLLMAVGLCFTVASYLYARR
jgi:hypothetical protein